jgi:hypothetical protein
MSRTQQANRRMTVRTCQRVHELINFDFPHSVTATSDDDDDGGPC